MKLCFPSVNHAPIYGYALWHHVMSSILSSYMEISDVINTVQQLYTSPQILRSPYKELTCSDIPYVDPSPSILPLQCVPFDWQLSIQTLDGPVPKLVVQLSQNQKSQLAWKWRPGPTCRALTNLASFWFTDGFWVHKYFRTGKMKCHSDWQPVTY